MVLCCKLVICAIFALVQCVRSDTVFSNQFLGNYLTDEEYKSREKCNTKVCLLDADRLIYAATRNGSVKPCDDFKTFAMGEFYLHRKKSERYVAIGFGAEVNHLLEERYRNALKSPIHKDDLRVHKYLKMHFKKCSDTDYITKHGGEEVLAYFNSLGGSPLIANETWDATKFDVDTFLHLEAAALVFLTGQGMSRCELSSEDPEQDKRDVICLKKQPRLLSDKTELTKILRRLNLEKSKQQTAIKDYEELIKIVSSVSVDSDVDNPKLMRVKDLSDALPHIKINWLKYFNNQLFSTSQITEDEEVLVTNPESLNQTLLLLSTIDKGAIANALTANFLFRRVEFFIAHFLRSDDAKKFGTKQNFQKFQACEISYHDNFFRLALDSLLAKTKFNKEIKSAATELVKEAVADIMSEFEEKLTSNISINQEVIGKLRNVQLQVMFLDEALNNSFIDKLYEELHFDETMSFFELHRAMVSYYFKVRYERKTSWKKALNRKNPNVIEYFVDRNILVVPAKYTLPPLFVVNRPRFFNLATLYTDVVGEMYTGILEYYSNNKERLNGFLENLSLADKNYEKFEKSGGKELQLSSFKLTNRQMLWLCMAHVHASQYQKKKSIVQVASLEIDYFHSFYKRIPRFRDAFQCGELTHEDEKKYSEYQNTAEILRKI